MSQVKKNPEEEKWRGIVEGCQRSSLKVKDYAQEQGISEKSLYRWAKKFDVSFKKPPLSFVEVSVKDFLANPFCLSVEIFIAKGGRIQLQAPFPQAIEIIKALL